MNPLYCAMLIEFVACEAPPPPPIPNPQVDVRGLEVEYEEAKSEVASATQELQALNRRFGRMAERFQDYSIPLAQLKRERVELCTEVEPHFEAVFRAMTRYEAMGHRLDAYHPSGTRYEALTRARKNAVTQKQKVLSLCPNP